MFVPEAELSEGPNPSADLRVASALEAQDWDVLWPELVRYAMGLIRSRAWMSAWGGRLPGAKEASDLVQEAIARVLKGRRTFPEGVDVAAGLKMTIKSLVSHEADGIENRRTVDGTSNTGTNHAGGSLEERLDSGKPPPDALVASPEVERLNAALIDELIAALGETDPPLVDLLGCFLDGVYKRADVARKLECSVDEVTNMGKRLERNLAKFRARHAGTIAKLRALQ